MTKTKRNTSMSTPIKNTSSTDLPQTTTTPSDNPAAASASELIIETTTDTTVTTESKDKEATNSNESTPADLPPLISPDAWSDTVGDDTKEDEKEEEEKAASQIILHPSTFVLTRFTTTPHDGLTDIDSVLATDYAPDTIFNNRCRFPDDFLKRLYAFTEIEYLHDEGIIAMELVKPSDNRFGFLACHKIYAFKSMIGKNGIVKHAKQYQSNYALDLIPLTRQGFINAATFIKMFTSKNVKNISISSESVPMSAFAPEDDPFKNIYDAKPLGSYNFQQDKNLPYPLDLKPGDIVVTQCLLEKFTETGTNLNRAAFKLIGVAYLGDGPTPKNDIATLTASPSKRALCKSQSRHISKKC
ncbi:uncharacterized protein EI90DRAFT_3294374 [Cantharellus anzutake]|uniref:uncharacterized protein n=1 Tax=Cantharellus anzutake TaxID=1750568 RepID=UPI00190804E0|nr:uncharacterized protein EI90DRAFT_3294374 [Cantharellus anzutake]KAF8313903.1 hypothetical protein EI90DRAFT_3294374 [Cantharellus anzutake]